MAALTILQVTLSTLVEGCLIPLVAILGTLGNLASISVLRDKNLDMKQTFRSEMCLLFLLQNYLQSIGLTLHLT